jgi:transglutaminase-like putative cysteine protease
MKYRVVHTTAYHYESSISVSHNRVILTPRNCRWLRCLWHRLTVHPAPTWSIKRHDAFGNLVHVFGVEEGHTELLVTAASQVEVSGQTLPLLSDSPAWEALRLTSVGGPSKLNEEALEVAGFHFASPRIPLLPVFADYAKVSFLPRRPVLEAALELTQRLYRDFKYDPKSTHVGTSVQEAFALRRGVCQDFAQIMIACCRSLGLATRYISGYLRTLPPPGKERLVGADQSHAWVSLYAGPEIGWVDLDPTNNGWCDHNHVPIARGRDYTDIVPFRGVFLGDGRNRLQVSVDVCPLEND